MWVSNCMLTLTTTALSSATSFQQYVLRIWYGHYLYLAPGTIRSNLGPFNKYDNAKPWDTLRRFCLIKPAKGEVEEKMVRYTLESVIESKWANLSVGEWSLLSLAVSLRTSALCFQGERAGKKCAYHRGARNSELPCVKPFFFYWAWIDGREMVSVPDFGVHCLLRRFPTSINTWLRCRNENLNYTNLGSPFDSDIGQSMEDLPWSNQAQCR